MNVISSPNETTEDIARLALRAAIDIDRFQRGRINTLETVQKLRSELIQTSGLVSQNGEAFFSGDAATANLIGAALYNLPEAAKQKINELAAVFTEMMNAVGDGLPNRDDVMLNKIRDFCLLLNQEAVRSRYNSDGEDSETDDERRIH